MTATATSADPATRPLGAAEAATLPVDEVRAACAVGAEGLSAAEAAARLLRHGPNAVASHRVRPWAVLWHQVRSPLLGLLLVAAVASYFLGEQDDAVIIGVILAVSVGLGFGNEYRAERAADALHSQIRHVSVVRRDGRASRIDVNDLVPGDLVTLGLGDVVPADLRLVEVVGLQCDESVLTGEPLPVDKGVDPVPPGTALADLSGCALMGTVVHGGAGSGIVVATGAATAFGRITAGLGTHQTDTPFQVGLRRFSMLLVYVAGALTVSIFVVNVVLDRPVLDALLFSLAIAVGITPQLLPAVVSISLAAGSRRMSRLEVLVKRLVCIEDLGDVDVLLTDKTGTLTLGRTAFVGAVAADGSTVDDVSRWGLLCTENALQGVEAVGGNALDRALWASRPAADEELGLQAWTRQGLLPFDHELRLVSVVVADRAGVRTLVTKGAPETVLERCVGVPAGSRDALAAEFSAGNRVVAVAVGAPSPVGPPVPADEHGLRLVGLLVFADPPKPGAALALGRLAALGIEVKVVTGDNPVVAAKVCADLGLGSAPALTGTDVDGLDDEALAVAIARTTVFARVSPEQKARIVRVRRLGGGGVAFLGDGVNDALALHAADVGISVEAATDVAKDAADVILLEKDLGVLADGVGEGRRIFANTMKCRFSRNLSSAK